MLNPYEIEKNSLAHIAAIQKLATGLRVALSQHILSEDRHLEPKYKSQLRSYITSETPQPKKYECKFCHEKFDEGRKLGGHVSRRHKNEIKNQMIDEKQEEIVSRPEPKKKTILRKRVQRVLSQRKSTNLDPIYESQDLD